MFEEYLKYTQKADELVISILESVDLPEANKLFSHVLNAQHIWAKRMQRQKPDFGVWQISNSSDFRAISQSNFEAIAEVLANIPLDAEVKYVNSKGEEFNSKIQEILLHLFNHSTYHRAQIATLLCKAGIEPPVTDYIIMKRSNQ